MSIVVYKCDTCKREIELQRNIHGLEHTYRCNITHGCRGKLYHQRLLLDHIRENLPVDVVGLDNWVPRKILFNFIQTIERNEWTINHQMGTNPMVSVFVNQPIEGNPDNLVEVTPEDVIIVDKNTIIVKLNRPWSGIAQLVGRQSDPTILDTTTIQPTDAVVPPYQISVNGTITVATRVSSLGDPESIPFNVEYRTPGSTTAVNYNAVSPTIHSPWSDANRITLKGKVYTVRTFYALLSDMASGAIGSGSTFRFVDVLDGSEYREIQRDEIVVLLAQPPYQTVDKITDKYIDVSSITEETNTFALYYNRGEFFALSQVAQNVYPHIRLV
jgi:hypothetical protein